MRHRIARRWLVLFLSPALVLYTVFMAIPAVRALGYSLQHWDGFGVPRWAGLDNFITLIGDRELFLRALSHNVILLVIGGGGALVLALTFAALIHRKIRGAGFFRVAFFFPNVIAAVAVALLWMMLYSTTEFGLINALLGKVMAGLAWLHLPTPDLDLPIAFLDSRNLVYALGPMLIWILTGFYMVLFLAAMQSIPESYYEAARLDGAGGLHQFFFITLPLIREVLAMAVIFLVITVMKFFDPVWVLENQRPTPDAHVLATLLYQKVFSEYNVGYGAAVAVMLFLIVLLATLFFMRVSRQERLEY
jgi:ABC-type sugar transport system permease subunit